jgi:hypothetical protein
MLLQIEEHKLSVETPEAVVNTMPTADTGEKKRDITLWRSCSGCDIDPRILIFFTSLMISVGVIVFSVVEISLATTCEQTNSYMSLLMFILGVWVPHPSIT